MSIIAERMSFIQPSPTLAISARAKELKAAGRDVIDLGLGEPDFNVPEFVKDAAIKAVQDNFSKYTVTAGTLSLRKAIAAKLQRENGLEYSPDEITVNCGGKHTIFSLFMATINKGDEVIIPAPYWVSYPDIVKLFEGVPVIVSGSFDKGFKITPEQLERAITPKTKWLIINSPSNPTGGAYTESELKGLAAVLLRHPGVYVMSDDIYEHLVFDGFKFYNIAMVEPALKPRVMVVNGLSKSFAMTGWRVGYAAGDKSIIAAVNKVQSQSISHVCSIVQPASEAALNGDLSFLTERNRILKERRDTLVALINKGRPMISCLVPEGAFYLYPNIEGCIGKTTPAGKKILNDTDFVTGLLEDKGVAAVQGAAFGLSPYFRISYAADLNLLKDAVARILDFCGGLK